MKTNSIVSLLLVLTFCSPFVSSAQQKAVSVRTTPDLGEAPLAPGKTALLPERGFAPQVFSETGPFVVNSDSREQTRQFYNAIYSTSENIPIDSTADVSDCFPGTNSTVFIEGVLRRINWMRAMAGVPAGITFNPTYNADDQEMALMISANNTLNHNPPPTYTCYTTNGASVAGSDQCIGADGADAVTDFIWDFGGSNSEVGHRRWLLLPQTLVMGTGDIPSMGSYSAANAIWVFDSSINDPRPATRQPYVSWPPEGYVPYQVAYPYWSFALSNADLSAATVSMTSNGVPVSTVIQPYETGYGENTLVWVPMGLDATCECTPFPFNGTDTVYGVTVSNINAGSSNVSFSYNVRLFDPSVPGSDYIPTTINGPLQPVLGGANSYTALAPNNTNVTSYNWIVAQLAPGNVSEDANYDESRVGHVVNFKISPPPNYAIITNAPDGSTNYCFHLCHDGTNSAPQLFQLDEVLFPATNATVSFDSLLGYATTDETARVQTSSDGGATWQDIFTEVGCDSSGNVQCETSFTHYSLTLTNDAATPLLLRFNYDFEGGSYYVDGFNFEGWCLENIVATNCSQVIDQVTNTTTSTNFTFVPEAPGSYALQAQPVIFTQFPLNGGPILQVNASGIRLNQPVVTSTQVQLSFSAIGLSSTTFHLLQSPQISGPWTTNTLAILTTNVPGSSYVFTAANRTGTQFYRVKSP